MKEWTVLYTVLDWLT